MVFLVYYLRNPVLLYQLQHQLYHYQDHLESKMMHYIACIYTSQDIGNILVWNFHLLKDFKKNILFLQNRVVAGSR